MEINKRTIIQKLVIMGGLWRLFILVSIPPILAYRPLIKNEMNFLSRFYYTILKERGDDKE